MRIHLQRQRTPSSSRATPYSRHGSTHWGRPPGPSKEDLAAHNAKDAIEARISSPSLLSTELCERVRAAGLPDVDPVFVSSRDKSSSESTVKLKPRSPLSPPHGVPYPHPTRSPHFVMLPSNILTIEIKHPHAPHTSSPPPRLDDSSTLPLPLLTHPPAPSTPT